MCTASEVAEDIAENVESERFRHDRSDPQFRRRQLPGISRDDDDAIDLRGTMHPKMAKHGVPVEDRHHEVEQNERVVIALEKRKRLSAVLCNMNFITAACEVLAEQEPRAGIVVDDEGGFCGFHGE